MSNTASPPSSCLTHSQKILKTVSAKSHDDDDPSGSGKAKSTATATTASTASPSLQRSDSSAAAAGVSASIIRAEASRQRAEDQAAGSGVFFPWDPRYKYWWGLTVMATILTAFYETYQIAFGKGGQVRGAPAILGYVLIGIFALDMLVNFNLAFYNQQDQIVWNRTDIRRNYFATGMFYIDFLGVFPFYVVVLAISGEIGNDNSLTQYLYLFRLFRLLRLHRVKQLVDVLQYSSRISFMTLTLTRNFCFCLVWTHLNACVFYFIARQHDFRGDDTWIGGALDGTTGFERYITSLYWSIVTFTTVGYGDFSPVNEIEQIFGMMYMLLNIIIQAWMIGSITLLIVKQDEKTGQYRDVLQTLLTYARAHEFDYPFYKRLKTQLQLDFDNKDLADEIVLSDFPDSVRRKVLRRLYMPSLLQTSLLQGVRQQFVDAFLSACHVELFPPGEEICTKGNNSTDLYLLVGGVVKLSTRDKVVKESTSAAEDWESEKTDSVHGGSSGQYNNTDENAVTTRASSSSPYSTTKSSGDFINAVGFFTQTPQMETVRTLTVCKTLTMSRNSYRHLVEDYPQSNLILLQNLLEKVQGMAQQERRQVGLNAGLATTSVATMNTAPSSADGEARDGNSQDDKDGNGTAPKAVRFENKSDDGNVPSEPQTEREFQLNAAHTTVQDLMQMHVNKLRDDRTTRFLFAASRGDMSTLTILLNQGLDPNVGDYDSRTALMVAAVKGQIEVVTKLLEYHANPNLVDMHGSSALLEAATHGHEEVMQVLMENHGKLCLAEARAASILCQAVFDGDIMLLSRLIRAGANVNAGDYDKRTAVHIAAAEGNVSALKVLVELGGANLDVKDRWNNSVLDEAKTSQNGAVLKYLESPGPA